MTSMKQGKIVIVRNGLYAGHTFIMVKTSDDGTAQTLFEHAVVVGIDSYLYKATKQMSKSKLKKDCKDSAHKKIHRFQTPIKLKSTYNAYKRNWFFQKLRF